jgi:hypothetical protein
LRRLSPTYMTALREGILSGITEAVIDDKDLDLQIRENYLNIYYKGNSLLKLTEVDAETYRAQAHKKFLRGVHIPDIDSKAAADFFVSKVPEIKQNIVKHGKRSLEIEYEQLIIRANNDEPRNNSEYFVVDRQYAAGKESRFDLNGFFWDRKRRAKGQTVPLAFMEIKFALNQDIQDLHGQLERYYSAVRKDAGSIAKEAQGIFRQKLELGLFSQSPARIEAMKTLVFSEDVSQYQFIVVLVDYNPHSRHLNLEKLRRLPFSRQIRIFRGGFAMWQQSLEGLHDGEMME